MVSSNKQSFIFLKGSLPKKNYFLLGLLSLKLLMIFPIVKWIIKKYLINSSNIEFIPGFFFFYGHNIYAKNCFLGDTQILDYVPVYIGEGTKFSFQNILITGSHDLNNFDTVIAKPIIIGKNVWITSRCIILPGVVIGDNTIIGAGSVVTKDIPANCIAAGNPAKVLKFRDLK
jgi:maltose O-acetyltransferase